MGQAAPIIITVVAVVATVYAGPMVGAAILESMGTTAAAIGVSEAVVGGAAIAGSTSAVNAAVQGKDVNGILEAGAKGTVAGAVGGAVGGAAGGGTVGGAAGGAAGGATSAALNKRDPITGALVGAAGGAVAGGVTSGLSNIPSSGDIGDPVYDPVTGQELTPAQVAAKNPDLYPGGVLPGSGQTTVYKPDGTAYYQANPSPTDIALGKASGAATGQYLSGLFSPSQSSSTYGGGLGSGSAFQDGTVTTTGQSGTTPGSSALGQALRIGDPGAPIESPGGGEKTNAPVWNLASLRTKDETGS